ncbi:hypothetical protein O181_006961 [Austropuccinia psidii MF-1]|uniref:Reverse transcriptase/retrotransposon-derived protein RNase H-like domain-containing protein n=1 Tax=Austropuccinia psidii MF-1 TaxID=1389203 RepID=A0A9Q3GH75_9BASI|nr:hypothetical protein [Austropuccinia psidii MF-1]
MFLPSSVHIPLILPSQSLLPSKDEVFKEIKDLGEDATISSLHLFQGDMDPPHSSFHASLEEKWDDGEDPEGIEAVPKVFPPAYHHYPYLFFKVTEEKLPLHCACDHHIKLEGLISPEALSQLQCLKEELTTSPILSHFNPSLPAIFHTESPYYSLGYLLTQANDSRKHPIAFDSGKLFPAKLNYELHYKEVLGIAWALKNSRDLLCSLSHSFEVWKDHSSYQYFISSKLLTCHQDFWAEFHFTITYCPGWLATLPDALSCCENLYPEGGALQQQES